MMTPHAIDIHDLAAGFGRKEVLRKLDLEIPSGSVCALLGRNGAGKTTLIRILMGFLHQRAGTVAVLGQDAWTSRFTLKERIGYVPDEQNLWPRMTGADLLKLSSRLYDRWDADFAAELVKGYRLPLDLPAGKCSKGTQLLLASVVAFAHRPDLLIFDEPVGSLDPIVRTQFTEGLLRYAEQSGATVLYSTQLVDEVEMMASRVAILHGGKILVNKGVDDLVGGYGRLVVLWDPGVQAALHDLPVLSIRRRDDGAVIVLGGDPGEAARSLARASVQVLDARRPTLQELFVALLDDESPESGSKIRQEVA